MVVQHNLTAMNSNRMLGLTTNTQAKSTEKLSSGYKINRAADDAAGLAISEKMRKQIRGLTQASANAQDGISAVQTAEGALTEVHDMLQRMNELAVKAANGTNSESDRTSIQAEIDQLSTEIDRVSETTKFNETYLLKGDQSPAAVKGYRFSYAAVAKPAKGTVTMNNEEPDGATGITAAVTLKNDTGASAEDLNTLAKALRDQGMSITATSEWIGTADDGDVFDSYDIALNGDAGKQYTVVSKKTAGQFEIQDAAGRTLATVTVGDYNKEGTAAKPGDKYTATINMTASSITATTLTGDRAQYYDADGNAISENALSDYVNVTGTGDAATVSQTAGKKLYDAVGNVITSFQATEISATQDQVATLRMSLHVGADATKNNQITLNLDAMSAKGLGINGLKVDGKDDTNALVAIETIKAALTKVSAQRSDLGAVQNRLEHTINNLDNVVENTTSAESAIRDTDMATEMVRYSNNNILAQAGQSMLAQANQSNQGVLSLLG